MSARKVSRELMDKMAAESMRLAGQDAERQRWAASVRRDDDAARVAVDLLAVPDRELRRRAVLVVRCDDCAGRVVAHVNYVDGRPMIWAAQRDGNGHRSWVDDEFWGDTAWCRTREYVLASADLLPELPAPGQPAAPDVRVSHNGKSGQLV